MRQATYTQVRYAMLDANFGPGGLYLVFDSIEELAEHIGITYEELPSDVCMRYATHLHNELDGLGKAQVRQLWLDTPKPCMF